jgi:uncharacterized membrane protein
MIQLILAALFFVGFHLAVAATSLRANLIERFGRPVYLAGYSTVSLIGLIWLAYAYRYADYVETWGQLLDLKPLVLIIVFIGFMLAGIGVTTPGPAKVGVEQLRSGSDAASGVLRITRHPTLWGVVLWAVSHLVVNGDGASLVLFSSILCLVLAGTVSVDRKRSQTLGDAWHNYIAITSNIPFFAILQGRNKLHLGEIHWWQWLFAIGAYVVMLWLHPSLFGVSPLP